LGAESGFPATFLFIKSPELIAGRQAALDLFPLRLVFIDSSTWSGPCRASCRGKSRFSPLDQFRAFVGIVRHLQVQHRSMYRMLATSSVFFVFVFGDRASNSLISSARGFAVSGLLHAGLDF